MLRFILPFLEDFCLDGELGDWLIVSEIPLSLTMRMMLLLDSLA